MAKLKIAPRKRFKPILKGTPLRVSVSIEKRYAAAICKAIDVMAQDTEQAIKELFEADNYAGDYSMDANIGSQARILFNGLSKRFDAMFAKIANPISEAMIDQVDNNSAATLKNSLCSIAGHMQFDTKILTGELNEVMTAATTESALLIKRVSAKYLDQIAGEVLRSIQSGNGLADLQPELTKYKVQTKNWARNVAKDQTNKAYSGLNAGRMQALGVDKYKWVHSHGGQHPNLYHLNELDGKICSLSNPPIIDKKTGTRGKPGDWFYCSCTMTPVVTFDDDED